jgi:hypothetical protein
MGVEQIPVILCLIRDENAFRTEQTLKDHEDDFKQITNI